MGRARPAVLLLTFLVTVHLAGLGDPASRAMTTSGLVRDTALLGGALTWAGLLASNEQ